MTLGGFPEPFNTSSELKAKRWSKEYRTRLIREDLPQLERVSELALVERLAAHLLNLVGSPLSINSLREDLAVSQTTVARWVQILERLYSVFRIYPFGAPKLRAVKKEAKHYHFDWTLVKEQGLRFENLVACNLLKWVHWIEDTQTEDIQLRHFRDTDKRAVDFVILKSGLPVRFIKCKSAQKGTSGSLKYIKQRFPDVDCVQVCLEHGRDLRTAEGIRRVPAHIFLTELI